MDHVHSIPARQSCMTVTIPINSVTEHNEAANIVPDCRIARYRKNYSRKAYRGPAGGASSYKG